MTIEFMSERRFFLCYPQRVCWSAILDEMKEIGRFWVRSFRPRWPTICAPCALHFLLQAIGNIIRVLKVGETIFK